MQQLTEPGDGGWETVGLGLVIRADQHTVGGTRFLTDSRCRLQVGLVCRKKGERIPVHRHASGTPEFLLVRYGAVEIEFGDDSRVELKAGDGALLLYGWHGVTFLEDSELLELKPGPYVADKEYRG